MRRLSWLVVVGLVLLMTGCSGHEIRIDITDDGSTVKVSPGQVLAVTLESNPSTGYGWYVLEELPAILEQQGEPEFVAEADSGDRVGAGGMTTLRFKTLKAGEAELTLGYRRPWEDKEPERTFEITVAVSE